MAPKSCSRGIQTVWTLPGDESRGVMSFLPFWGKGARDGRRFDRVRRVQLLLGCALLFTGGCSGRGSV